MSIVEIRNSSFTYPQNKEQTLCNINLEIEKGEYVAIVGKNGSGKSTLARMIAGFFEPDSGTVNIADGVLPGIVFQQPKEQIVASVVARDTAFGPQNLSMTKDEIELRTIECLTVTGLADRALSGTYELSLGQTQRLAFSGILALFPELLILDEVTAMLDPVARNELNEFIQQWNRRGCTVIHVTHDEDEALNSKRIIALEKGSVIFDGSPAQMTESKIIYEKIFADASLEDLAYSCGKKNEAPEVLTVENLWFSYKDRAVFSNVNFSLKKGSLVSLTGPSGCGKSTLFECLAGLLKNTGGIIRASSQPSLALQESEASLFERYAADDVAFGPRNKKVEGRALLERVKKSMDMAGLPYSEFANRGTFYLSGGEKRKLRSLRLMMIL